MLIGALASVENIEIEIKPCQNSVGYTDKSPKLSD